MRVEPTKWCPPLDAACAGLAADDAVPCEVGSELELCAPPSFADLDAHAVVGLEAGCGCGSAALPLLRAHPGLFMSYLSVQRYSIDTRFCQTRISVSRVSPSLSDLWSR